MKKNISILLAVVLVLSALTLSGCTKRDETPAVEETPVENPVETVTPAPAAEAAPTAAPTSTPAPAAEPVQEAKEEPAKPASPINPLTGEPLAEDISSLRPITCMLNNHPDALPQCGITSADIIYELPEEGITRMLGVFAQMPDCDRLGSVRSSRPYHADVSLSYDAIFVHWGRSEKAANFLYNTGIDHIELNESPAGEYAYRDYSHTKGGTEHTGFIKVDQLQKFIDEHNWRTEHEGEHEYGFAFSDNVQLTGGAAEKVRIYLAGKASNFEYSAADGGYKMYEYGQDYVDGDTNVMPVFKNVLALRTTIYDETSLADIVLTDTKGTGTIYCNGQKEDFTWERAGYDDNFHYYKQDGSPLEFGVGKTYICVISNGDTVELY